MRGQRKNPRKAVQPFENKKRKIDIFKNYEANGVEKIQRKLEIFSTLISKKSNLGCAEVARLIRTETRRKVNISEVKRRLSVSESAAAQIRQPNSLDVINLCEGEADEESTLSISAKGMTFEFKTQRPEESVIFILSRMRGDVI